MLMSLGVPSGSPPVHHRQVPRPGRPVPNNPSRSSHPPPTRKSQTVRPTSETHCSSVRRPAPARQRAESHLKGHLEAPQNRHTAVRRKTSSKVHGSSPSVRPSPYHSQGSRPQHTQRLQPCGPRSEEMLCRAGVTGTLKAGEAQRRRG
jgi:hypothetical protein